MSAGFDVVIIGSGAGGSPAACILAEAGLRVLLLERGVAYTRGDFDRDEIEWCRRDRFVPAPRTDPHTRRSDEGQRAAVTSDGWISTVLGGGTVHMGAYLLRGHADDARQATRFAAAGDTAHTAIDWAVPFERLAPFYDDAERTLGVSGAPASGVPALTAHTLAQKVDAAADSLGFTSTPTPRGILSVPRPDDDRLPCAYRQLCASYGCPNDAKSSMPATYLRRAAKTGRLTVRTRALATRLLRDDVTGKATGVVVRDLERQTEETIEAATFIVAAGAIESARLLLMSGASFDPHRQIGRNLWFSLFVEVGGFFAKESHADVADLMAGSSFLNRSVNVDGVVRGRGRQSGTEGGSIDRSSIDRSGMFQASFVHDNPIHRAERVATETLEGGKLLWGRGLKQELLRQFRGGRQVILEGFGEFTPHRGAYVDLDPEVRDQFDLPAARLTVWHHPRDQRVAARLRADGQALLTAMGAADVKILRGLSETTVLQGGTCRFGEDPTTSVTTPDGHLHSTSNVYVTDGGALPSSLTVPVTLTIVANSLRIAQGIAGQYSSSSSSSSSSPKPGTSPQPVP